MTLDYRSLETRRLTPSQKPQASRSSKCSAQSAHPKPSITPAETHRGMGRGMCRTVVSPLVILFRTRKRFYRNPLPFVFEAFFCSHRRSCMFCTPSQNLKKVNQQCAFVGGVCQQKYKFGREALKFIFTYNPAEALYNPHLGTFITTDSSHTELPPSKQ